MDSGKRSPANHAAAAIAIATHHGQRCSKHNSHGCSPPQDCDNSTAPSTATLAASTAPANPRVVRAALGAMGLIDSE
jgi:hypothetical protein